MDKNQTAHSSPSHITTIPPTPPSALAPGQRKRRSAKKWSERKSSPNTSSSSSGSSSSSVPIVHTAKAAVHSVPTSEIPLSQAAKLASAPSKKAMEEMYSYMIQELTIQKIGASISGNTKALNSGENGHPSAPQIHDRASNDDDKSARRGHKGHQDPVFVELETVRKLVELHLNPIIDPGALNYSQGEKEEAKKMLLIIRQFLDHTEEHCHILKVSAMISKLRRRDGDIRYSPDHMCHNCNPMCLNDCVARTGGVQAMATEMGISPEVASIVYVCQYENIHLCDEMRCTHREIMNGSSVCSLSHNTFVVYEDQDPWYRRERNKLSEMRNMRNRSISNDNYWRRKRSMIVMRRVEMMDAPKNQRKRRNPTIDTSTSWKKLLREYKSSKRGVPYVGNREEICVPEYDGSTGEPGAKRRRVIDDDDDNNDDGERGAGDRSRYVNTGTKEESDVEFHEDDGSGNSDKDEDDNNAYEYDDNAAAAGDHRDVVDNGDAFEDPLVSTSRDNKNYASIIPANIANFHVNDFSLSQLKSHIRDCLDVARKMVAGMKEQKSRAPDDLFGFLSMVKSEKPIVLNIGMGQEIRKRNTGISTSVRTSSKSLDANDNNNININARPSSSRARKGSRKRKRNDRGRRAGTSSRLLESHCAGEAVQYTNRFIEKIVEKKEKTTGQHVIVDSFHCSTKKGVSQVEHFLTSEEIASRASRRSSLVAPIAPMSTLLNISDADAKKMTERSSSLVRVLNMIDTAVTSYRTDGTYGVLGFPSGFPIRASQMVKVVNSQPMEARKNREGHGVRVPDYISMMYFLAQSPFRELIEREAGHELSPIQTAHYARYMEGRSERDCEFIREAFAIVKSLSPGLFRLKTELPDIMNICKEKMRLLKQRLKVDMTSNIVPNYFESVVSGELLFDPYSYPLVLHMCVMDEEVLDCVDIMLHFWKLCEGSPYIQKHGHQRLVVANHCVAVLYTMVKGLYIGGHRVVPNNPKFGHRGYLATHNDINKYCHYRPNFKKGTKIFNSCIYSLARSVPIHTLIYHSGYLRRLTEKKRDRKRNESKEKQCHGRAESKRKK